MQCSLTSGDDETLNSLLKKLEKSTALPKELLLASFPSDGLSKRNREASHETSKLLSSSNLDFLFGEHLLTKGNKMFHNYKTKP